jgi:hypothetical protein
MGCRCYASGLLGHVILAMSNSITFLPLSDVMLVSDLCLYSFESLLRQELYHITFES